jgi:esterase/lipase
MIRKYIWVPVLFLAILAVILLAGPRVEIDTTLQPVQLPADLDGYLRESEAQFDDIVPGAEKTIVWAGEPGQKTPLSVIYLHGFSATRQETAPLSDKLAAELGANLYYGLFTGHGRSGEALADATVNDWLNDANEALEIGRRLGEEVVVIGTSTGGTAAAWLAAQPNTEDVRALILISPNFAPQNRQSEILTWLWGEQIAKMIIGPERSWEPADEMQARFWTERYPTEALLPMMAMVKLARGADLEGASAPLLVIYSPDDEVVSPAFTEEAFARYGAAVKERYIVENSDDPSNHVIAGDIVSPNTTDEVLGTILTFLEQLEDPN